MDKLNELYEVLDEKYDLYRLLTGELAIDDILDTQDVMDFIGDTFTISDVEEYILRNVK